MYTLGFMDSLVEGGSEKNKEVDRLDMIKLLKEKLPSYLHIVGSLAYSNRKYVGDIDLVTIEVSLDKVYEYFSKNFEVEDVMKFGSRIMTLDLMIDKQKVKLNVWYGTKEEKPFMMLAYSYPKRFNIAIRSKLKKLGYKLSQYDMRSLKTNKKIPDIKSMKDIFDMAKINYRTPKEEGKKLNL